MRKRKTLASPVCEPEEVKQKTKRQKQITEGLGTMEEKDLSNISVKEEAIISSNNNLEDTKDDALDSSVKTTNILMIVGKEDDISKGADAEPERRHNVLGMIDPSTHEVKSTSLKETGNDNQKKEKKSIGISVKEDVLNPSLQVVHVHFSSDNSYLPNDVDTDSVRKKNSEESFNYNPNPPIDEEKSLSNSAAADIVKKSDISPVFDSSSYDVISTSSKQYKVYRKRVKSSDTSVACSSLPVDQDEVGRLRKISNEASHCDDLGLLAAKENSALIGGACADLHKCGMLPEINPNSDSINIKNGHEEKESKGKKNVFYSSQHNESDSYAISPSLSENVELYWVGEENVHVSVKSKLLQNIDAEDCIEKSADDASPDKNNISFEIPSKSYQVEDHCQTKMAEEKETHKTIKCTPCSTDHVLEDIPDEVLQVNMCGVSDISDKAPASEKVKMGKHNMHENRVSNDISLEKENKGLLDGFCKVPDASDVSAEGSLKVLSTDCREPPSPIRGVMHECACLDNTNKKNAWLDSSKQEEVSFSFLIAAKTIMNESSDDNSDKGNASDRGVGSDTIDQKDNITSSMSNCTQRETCQEKREVTTLSMSNIVENVVTSDAITIPDKELDVVLGSPERPLASRTGKKLLVLDLNGLLADIFIDIRNAHKALKKVGGKSVSKRPFCDDFLKFCFEKFDIGIWSSRKGYNVENVVNFLMGDSKHQLLFTWDQSKCTYTGFRTLENVHKPLVLKELKKLWNKEESDLPWEKGEYSPSNTLLVDDSPYKALCNPPHTAIFPYPYRFDDENDTSLGPGGDLRVYLEGLAVADDVQRYVQEHQFGQHPITATDPSWSFYLQVIDKIEKSSVPTQ